MIFLSRGWTNMEYTVKYFLAGDRTSSIRSQILDRYYVNGCRATSENRSKLSDMKFGANNEP